MSSLKILKWARWAGIAVTSIALLFHGLLAIGTVPAPNARNSEEVTGKLLSASLPHPDFGDMSIILDNGRRFYVNRANEVDHFAWEEFLAETQPGDEVTLTTVNTLAKRWVGIGGSVSPLAGIQTPEKVYMDPAVAARTWLSQAMFSTLAFYIGGVWLAFIASGYFLNNPKYRDQIQPKTA